MIAANYGDVMCLIKKGEYYMEWEYSQSTGILKFNLGKVTTGYAGHGNAKNNPAMEHVKIAARSLEESIKFRLHERVRERGLMYYL